MTITNYFFFASNTPSENKGGYDIYYCQKTKDGSWSEPKSLPGNVNSAGNEVFRIIIRVDCTSLLMVILDMEA